jgi:molybdate transport system substrate-binding protein
MRALMFLVVATHCFLAAPAYAQTLKVSVAVSLKEAVTEIAKAYEEKTGDKVELAFGSSGQLAAQIKNGHGADVFISAAQKQVDDLAKENLTLDTSRRVLAGNSLVLITPKDAKANHPITDFKDLADPAVKRVAMGEPKTVPAGQYAQQTLDTLKLSEPLKGRIVYGANVRQVLAYVEMGEVDAGIVYATDAKESGDKVKVVKTAESSTHDPIIYPAVILKASKKADSASQFLDFFASEKARAILTAKGFAPVAASK